MRDMAGAEKLKLFSNYENTGNARIKTDEIEISGGADFAEHFDVISNHTEEIQAGYLVSIDQNSSGKLTISEHPYDNKLAGIISGANGIRPGMLMGQTGGVADGDYPVALSGRVYVFKDNLK